MISHLNNRFSDVQLKAIMALSIVPSVFMTDQEADSSLEEELIEHYHDDLPSPSTLQQDLHMLKKADFQIHLQSHLNMLIVHVSKHSYASALNLYIACDKK